METRKVAEEWGEQGAEGEKREKGEGQLSLHCSPFPLDHTFCCNFTSSLKNKELNNIQFEILLLLIPIAHCCTS